MSATDQIRGFSERLALAGWKVLDAEPREHHRPSAEQYQERFTGLLVRQCMSAQMTGARNGLLRSSVGLTQAEARACQQIAVAFTLRMVAEWGTG